jgi:hypothetical protein
VRSIIREISLFAVLWNPIPAKSEEVMCRVKWQFFPRSTQDTKMHYVMCNLSWQKQFKMGSIAEKLTEQITVPSEVYIKPDSVLKERKVHYGRRYATF